MNSKELLKMLLHRVSFNPLARTKVENRILLSEKDNQVKILKSTYNWDL